jgi:hypothetical protein
MTWQYDEMRQVGVDFESAEQAAQYDARQGTGPQAHRQLLERLRILPGQVAEYLCTPAKPA